MTETDSYTEKLTALLCARSRLLYLKKNENAVRNEEKAVVPSLSVRGRKSHMKTRDSC